MYFRPREIRRVQAQFRIGRRIIAGCLGKKRYRSELAAIHVIFQMWVKGLDLLAPYECPHCGAWHVGHNGLANTGGLD